MTNEDKELTAKILRCIEFMKKECPECYKKMKECCPDTDKKSND